MPFGLDLDPFKDSWNANNKPLKWPGRLLGLVTVAMFIAAEKSTSSELAIWSKVLFLSGIVGLPLVGLNRDLRRYPTAWLILTCLVGAHVAFLRVSWSYLEDIAFPALAVVGFTEALLLNAPLVLLRKRIGVDYPSGEVDGQAKKIDDR